MYSLSCILVKACKNEFCTSICCWCCICKHFIIKYHCSMFIITTQFYFLFDIVSWIFLCIIIFCILVSSKQLICDANKFGFTIICSKCKFNEQMLRDCISINYFQYNFKWGIFGLYCVVVFKWNISCSTTRST